MKRKLDPAVSLPAANYDEARVPAYRLPDPLAFVDGSPVKTAQAWSELRRPEIVALFEEHVFGRSPGRPRRMECTTVAQDGHALGGIAIRREVAVSFGADAPKLHLLIYLPRRANAPSPVVLGPNFLGNHTIHPDRGIMPSEAVFVPGMDVALADGRATDASRGLQADRWPVERILGRGYGLATFFYGNLFPDRADGRPLSVQPLFDRNSGTPYSWGAIATWSWAMSRALDALVSMPEIDARRVALFGHSRHGKAALWAGAMDERFGLVIANNSGKGGAGLMRRNFGETIRHLVTRYPHWFTRLYADFADREFALPVDQHMLIALMAPRPVYVASAEEDLWADPRGEFLGALGAVPVYRLFGAGAFEAQAPPAERPILSIIGYHVRRGGHGVTAYDWERFLDFADLYLV